TPAKIWSESPKTPTATSTWTPRRPRNTASWTKCWPSPSRWRTTGRNHQTNLQVAFHVAFDRLIAVQMQNEHCSMQNEDAAQTSSTLLTFISRSIAAMPLVPYVIEKSGREERVMDIYSRLLSDRIVFLGTAIND